MSISPAVILFSLLALKNFHLETSRRAYNSKQTQDQDIIFIAS